MNVEFDPDKDAANIEKHGLSFRDFPGFDDLPIVSVDERHDYDEDRFLAIGRIGDRYFAIIYVERGTRIRLISFRRAHAKEYRQYERRLGRQS